MTSERASARGHLLEVDISSLRLDAQNPRLPESHRGGSQEDLAVVLEMGFDAFAVAQSIADNGFFVAEPLIAIPGDEDGEYIVVEGNRRLTALLGLAHPEIRGAFAEPQRWHDVAARARVTTATTIPVVVHQSRRSTHAEVARAHVVGKLQWRPYMQAKFIAARVAEGKSLAEVADLIGITKSKAADLYRDQAIVEQARQLGLPATEIEKAFSLLTVAMSQTKLRDHIGAPLGSKLSVGDDPIPEDKSEELGELVGWIFGSEESEPLINDSRQMSQLGGVISSPVGLAAVRGGNSLEEARNKVTSSRLDPKDRLLKRLTTGRSSILAACDDVTEYADDPEVEGMVADVEAAVESLRSAMLEDEL